MSGVRASEKKLADAAIGWASVVLKLKAWGARFGSMSSKDFKASLPEIEALYDEERERSSDLVRKAESVRIARGKSGA